MIPLRDTIHSRRLPVINWLLILINALVFFYELSLTPVRLEQFIITYGLVPARIHLLDLQTAFPFVTHMFLHAGWFHIISNMWVLFIFGDNVEDRMGSLRYLVFYLLGGIAAGAIQTFVDQGSQVPSLGASGAIAAVMGAYFLFFPTARIVTLIPLFIFPWLVEIPALVFLGFWFISQFFSGLLAIATPNGVSLGGVAWWAHIGGFIFGLVLARPFAYHKPRETSYPEDIYPW